MTRILEAVLRWLEWRLAAFPLPGPIVVQDHAAWLRMGPNEQARWFPTEAEALRG